MNLAVSRQPARGASRSPTGTSIAGGSAHDAPENWHVSTDICDDSGTHAESHVGDINIVLIDVYDTHDPFSLLDGEDADLGLIAETIFSGTAGSTQTWTCSLSRSAAGS